MKCVLMKKDLRITKINPWSRMRGVVYDEGKGMFMAYINLTVRKTVYKFQVTGEDDIDHEIGFKIENDVLIDTTKINSVTIKSTVDSADNDSTLVTKVGVSVACSAYKSDSEMSEKSDSDKSTFSWGSDHSERNFKSHSKDLPKRSFSAILSCNDIHRLQIKENREQLTSSISNLEVNFFLKRNSYIIMF
jgi:hypothetical protein